MKLAEALALRASYRKKLAELRERLSDNAKVQEGEVSPENPMELLSEVDHIESEREKLIAKINFTNTKTVKNGLTMTELIAKRDILHDKIDIYEDLVIDACDLIDRISNREIIIRSNIDVKTIQKQIDDMRRESGELEIMIQELNWTTELV